MLRRNAAEKTECEIAFCFFLNGGRRGHTFNLRSPQGKRVEENPFKGNTRVVNSTEDAIVYEHCVEKNYQGSEQH